MLMVGLDVPEGLSDQNDSMILQSSALREFWAVSSHRETTCAPIHPSAIASVLPTHLAFILRGKVAEKVMHMQNKISAVTSRCSQNHPLEVFNANLWKN